MATDAEWDYYYVGVLLVLESVTSRVIGGSNI